MKINGYVESNEPDIFSSEEGAQISIICPDPYFYSADDDGRNVTHFYSVIPMLEFPLMNDSLTDKQIVMSEIKIKTTGVVTNTGDADVGMMIYIHAADKATNITIYNIETKESMLIDTTKIEKMTGSGLIAGDDIVINTKKGEKSITLIRDGVSYNILNCLDKNTDWFTLAKGDNLFGFTTEEGISNLQFRIENEVIYEGV